ncbi:dynein light chain 1, axonemal-like isoform X1 [Teleopsis dalmanni]|uniref:dynein light chain 1, axonemal-like isoform X1 n=1 Tax=Teleopsis dalmanni TaxID=139649 RepID=UPI0018CEA41D|nr:dynein light chain 1, axonemal-like isoform X1 [Teleopsis dalmanni]
MFKPTSIKEAISLWQLKNSIPASEAHEVGLQFQWPPIEKMDSSLARLVECRKLSLSTNLIDRISGLGTLKNLKVLELSHLKLRSLLTIYYFIVYTPQEVLENTLEELIVSYNYIEKLHPIDTMKALKVFNVSNNLVKDWVDFNLMATIKLESLSFLGNPLQERFADDGLVYKMEVRKRLPNLKYLDGDQLKKNSYI